jgi:hypothetical protein
VAADQEDGAGRPGVIGRLPPITERKGFRIGRLSFPSDFDETVRYIRRSLLRLAVLRVLVFWLLSS